MTDVGTRRLERLAASGDRVAEVRLLRERLRTGDLTPDHLALAAFLGHPAALEATEDSVPDIEDTPRWAGELVRWGKEACVRAAVAAARCTLPIWNRYYPDNPLPGRLLTQAQAWVDCPCPDHELEAGESTIEVREFEFGRCRCARATLQAVRAAASPVTSNQPRRVGDLDRLDAERLVSELRGEGARVEAEPMPTGRYALLLYTASTLGFAAVRILQNAGVDWQTAKRLVSERRSGTDSCDYWAEVAVALAIDRVWADEGLTDLNIRVAIRRELIPWALLGRG